LSRGVAYATAAYILWGLFPLYWKALDDISASQILGHRIVWSLVFVGLILTLRHNWGWMHGAVRQPRVLLTFAISGTLLAINWFTYIWGVNAGFIVETSLGYFINPLVNVLLGYLILKERLRSGQWLALSIALGGVLYLGFNYGSFPWIALTLAFSFGTYGLIRKTAALNSAEGLFLETAILFLPALGFLLLHELRGTGTFAHTQLSTTVLLIGAGVVTSIPLLLFAAGARLITMTTLGLLQYIAPTLQFLIGIVIYNEPFGPTRIIGFSLIWLALLVYTFESLHHRRRVHALETVAKSP
jgi:chloramphenicol-sensitive protein RarD